MESVLEKLERMTKNIENTSYKIISKEIVSKFFKGIFYNQEDLANSCYVSVSQITKFAKKIGYSGYRELLFNLKNEYSHYGWDKKNLEISTIEKFDQLSKWIMKNEKFVKTIAKEIKNKEIINVYVSYQVRHAATFPPNWESFFFFFIIFYSF
ncbi:hypothetical protein [Spiroplasma floricola]|uniref:HTH rpiR-type domain-containing protein n=1 Tax=Spiroplasma floricola 23-6 TaxID=1336749 RepID=A0A2K8SCZ3_9MOLU|nr:hypothetical protein [Spiroplasma floricola]AUB31312.1 hypothetical protein SFLOR_v1c02510 [Spiroplasma floricola 23-6]